MLQTDKWIETPVKMDRLVLPPLAVRALPFLVNNPNLRNFVRKLHLKLCFILVCPENTSLPVADGLAGLAEVFLKGETASLSFLAFLKIMTFALNYFTNQLFRIFLNPKMSF
jgi:hypothetical protein